ncbi:MAG TPA: amidohydrolase [Firmicutes bacterium]|nr:amidohydrolase [Candidatus Fermentithermobacillaceae bacterium]
MIVIKNARICTISHGVIENGSCAIENGRIVALGPDITPTADSEVVDASGKWLVPGLIDCHCHVGIWPEGEDSSDENENTDAVTANLSALDGINFSDRAFDDALEGGVTSIMVHPGSTNIIAGTSVALKTAGKSIGGRILRNPAALKVAWTPSGRGGLPSFGAPYPSTRMGIVSIFREQFKEAREYLSTLELGKSRPLADPRKRRILEMLGMVLRHEMPVRVHCMMPADIYGLFRLQDEFGFEFTVEHGDEAHLVAGQLASRRVPVNYGPLLGDRWFPMFSAARPDAAKILNDAGVLVSFITDHPVVSVRDLRMQASICVKHGLSHESALKMLTLNPASVMGVDSRIGSIDVGKDADLVLFSGDPLSVRSRVDAVFVDGIRVR